LVICVDLVGVLQAAGALRKARDGDAFVLLDPGVADALLRVLPAGEITFNELDVRAHHYTVVDLLPLAAGERHGVFWQHSWNTERVARGQPEQALVMPLPAPPGIARRLVFLRGAGPPFGDTDRDAAALLQPHVADALRVQGRRAASRLLTGRQRELLRLVAAGHDNIAIACQLGLSPATVRKHLENAFVRLEVSSRTAAVAKICPDAAWR
jgi:DNA-binding CsgD family transcriptional regulator